MGLLTGAGRVMGGVMVEVGDPTLSVEEAVRIVKAVFGQRLGTVWPEAVAKFQYSLAPNKVGETRWIAVYGLDVASEIAVQACASAGNQAFVDMLDRVASAAEVLMRRRPEAVKVAAQDDDQEMPPPPRHSNGADNGTSADAGGTEWPAN